MFVEWKITVITFGTKFKTLGDCSWKRNLSEYPFSWHWCSRCRVMTQRMRINNESRIILSLFCTPSHFYRYSLYFVLSWARNYTSYRVSSCSFASARCTWRAVVSSAPCTHTPHLATCSNFTHLTPAAHWVDGCLILNEPILNDLFKSLLVCTLSALRYRLSQKSLIKTITILWSCFFSS